MTYMQKIFYTFLYFWAFSPMLFAQSAILKGTVKDDKGEGLIGATITSGTQGVVTDIDGNYSMTLAAGVYTLEYSYVGYTAQKKEIRIIGSEVQVIDIQLVDANNILNQVTVTSGRYERKLGEVTVSLDILKPDLIERNNTQSIDKVLEKVPGVAIVGGQPSIRGGSGFSYGAGSRVLILVDDIPALQADAGSPNWSDFQVETIEQIEVVKGAASALYGSSALNGVINIRTAYAKDKPITTFSTFYNSYDDPKDKSLIWYDKQPFSTGFNVTHRRKINKLDLVLGTNWQTTSSFNKDTYDSTGRITIGTRYRLRENLQVGFNANINFGTSKYFFYWLDGDKGVMQGTPSTITKNRKLRYTIDPFISYFDKKGNRHKLLGRFFSVENRVSGGNQNQSDLYYGEYQYQRAWEGDWVTTAGLVSGATFIRAQLYGDTTYRSFNLAPYVQIEKKINRLNLAAGARYERNSVHSPEYIRWAKTSPRYDTIPNGVVREARPVFRLGANYQVSDYTYLRASIGQGYRFPTVAEKFITSNLSAAFIIPNTKLRSETGWSSEIGVKQGLKIGQWNGFADASVFWTEYQDMMEFVFIPQYLAFQSQNVGNTRIRGAEFTLAGQGNIGKTQVSLLTGYTYIDPRFKEFGTREMTDISVDYNVLKYRFRHAFKFDGEAKYKGVALGLSSNYNSFMEAIDKIFNQIIPGVKEFREKNNAGVNIVDVRLSYSFLRYYKLSFLLKNATNVLYTQRPALLEAPRNFNMRLDVKF